jgi:hypothetical protein
MTPTKPDGTPRPGVAAALERRYRRLLAWYPAEYRQAHEEEILAVLLACRPTTPTGRRALALLTLPGTAYLMTLTADTDGVAARYGVPAAVAAAVLCLLWTASRLPRRRRPSLPPA